MKTLYGLSDSADFRCETFANFHIHNLRMEQCSRNIALFCRLCATSLIDLSGSYADDVIQRSLETYKAENRNQIQEHFNITLDNDPQLFYTVLLCDTSENNMSTLSKAHYIRWLNLLAPDADF